MPEAINAVLFDLDNTLADRDGAFIAWARWFVHTQLGLTDDATIAEVVSTLVRLDDGGHGSKEAMFRTLEERYPSLTDGAATLINAFREQLLLRLPPLAGETVELLAALDAAGIPWGIVSNGSIAQLGKIHKLGLADRSGCLVISEEVGLRKPDPEIFRLAAGRLRVAAGTILFVGDNPEADIMGAANAGMRTAWLRRGRKWPAHLAPAPPDLTIDSLHELIWISEFTAGAGATI